MDCLTPNNKPKVYQTVIYVLWEQISGWRKSLNLEPDSQLQFLPREEMNLPHDDANCMNIAFHIYLKAGSGFSRSPTPQGSAPWSRAWLKWKQPPFIDWITHRHKWIYWIIFINTTTLVGANFEKIQEIRFVDLEGLEHTTHTRLFRLPKRRPQSRLESRESRAQADLPSTKMTDTSYLNRFFWRCWCCIGLLGLLSEKVEILGPAWAVSVVDITCFSCSSKLSIILHNKKTWWFWHQIAYFFRKSQETRKKRRVFSTPVWPSTKPSTRWWATSVPSH